MKKQNIQSELAGHETETIAVRRCLLGKTKCEHRESADEHLAEASAGGCRRCFEILVNRYRQKIFYFITGKIGNREDAEDIVQETFLKVYSNMHRFNSEYSFKTWIYTISHNCMVSSLRRNRTQKTVLQLPEELTSPELSHEKLVEDRECAAQLWKTARQLAPDQFCVLWLKYHELLDISAIAKIMRKTQVNIRVILHRARSSLYSKLPIKDIEI